MSPLDIHRSLRDTDPTLPGASAGIERSAGSASALVDGAANYADNVVMRGRQGHGFAAEKMNHLHDKLVGHDARLVGGDNAKNGADRMVNGAAFQTKFCETASASVSNCIDAAGEFRYGDMKVEVPKGQAAEARALLKAKIRTGKVKGISESRVDETIVESPFTYEQAKNMAKAGTIESLSYDAVNGLQLAGTAMGLSVALTFALGLLNGKRWQDALDAACFEGLCVGGVAWVGSIATAQLSRTLVENGLRSGTDWISRQFTPKAAAWLVNASKGGAASVSEKVAQQHLSKLLRGNVVAGIATTAILSADDFILLFDGKVSGAQAFKNVAKTASGVAGGTAGWVGGAATGAAIGSAIPLIGTAVGGFLGGLFGSAAAGGLASSGAAKVLDHYIEDDAKDMLRCIENVFAQLAEDYLLTQDEANAVLKEFNTFDLPKLLRELFSREHRENYAYDLLIPLVRERIDARGRLALPTDAQLCQGVSSVIERLADEQAGAPTTAVPPTPLTAPDAGQAAPAPAAKPRTLEYFLEEYEAHLTANSSVLMLALDFSGKYKKKRSNAVNAFAYDTEDYKSEPAWSLLMIDFTAMGSGKDGLWMTGSHLYIKPSWSDRARILIKDIKQLRLDEEARELSINGKSYAYVMSSLTPQMRILVKCINRFLDQFR